MGGALALKDAACRMELATGGGPVLVGGVGGPAKEKTPILYEYVGSSWDGSEASRP